MAFKSLAVPIGTSDTDVYLCPATSEAAAVLAVANKTGSAVAVDIKVYRQASGTTETIADDWSIAANQVVKYPVPISLEANDKVIMTAASVDALVASGTVTFSSATPVETGFTPRGDWNSGAGYIANDVVSYTDGNSYLAIQANTNSQPDSNPADWMVNAEKGPVPDKASNANVFAATVDKYLAADNIETASAYVTITEAATTTPDWQSFINGVLTLTDDRNLAIPTNGIPGTYRKIKVIQGGAGGFELTLAAGYLTPGGDALTFAAAAGVFHTLELFCDTTSLFHATLVEDWS